MPKLKVLTITKQMKNAYTREHKEKLEKNIRYQIVKI